MEELVKLSDWDATATQLRSRAETIKSVPTPKVEIKDKLGFDYVSAGYMRKLADKHYPGWCWEIINQEIIWQDILVQNQKLQRAVYMKIHGRLKWIDSGIMRYYDQVAAHRIQLSKTTYEYVDMGNDIKAAVTDCLKKALNMGMGIAEDIYFPSDRPSEESFNELLSIMDTMIKLGYSDSTAKETIIEKNAEGNLSKSDVERYIAKGD